MSYNSAIEVWQYEIEARAAGSTNNTPIVIEDGHARIGKRGIVARFTDDAHAERILAEAGFVKTEKGWLPK